MVGGISVAVGTTIADRPPQMLHAVRDAAGISPFPPDTNIDRKLGQYARLPAF